jgi:hypothetical protein
MISSGKYLDTLATKIAIQQILAFNWGDGLAYGT